MTTLVTGAAGFIGFNTVARLLARGDDVVDIAERFVAGVLVPGFNKYPSNVLGDGVYFNDRPYLPVVPYVGPPYSGSSSPPSRAQCERGERESTGRAHC